MNNPDNPALTEGPERLQAGNAAEVKQEHLIPLTYTLEQTAIVLNFHPKTIRRLIARGLLTPCRAVRKIVIPREQVIAFLKASCGELTLNSRKGKGIR